MGTFRHSILLKTKEDLSSLEAEMGSTPVVGGGAITHSIGGSTPLEDRIKERLSLVGKLCVEPSVGSEVLKNTMGRIWKISKQARFKAVGKNVFTITLATEADN